MKRWLPLYCVLLIGAPARGQEADAKKREPTLRADGFLQKLREPLGQIFTFTFDGPNLKLDRASWERAAPAANNANQPAIGGIRGNGNRPAIERLFASIQSLSGAGGWGRSTSGDDCNVYFRGRSASGRLRTRGKTLRLSLDEEADPARSFQLNIDDKDGFRLQVTHPSGDVLIMNQSSAGRFVVVVVAGEHVFTGQDKSFVAFFKKHRQEMDEQVLPVLASMGIRPVLSPRLEQVRDAVLATLSRSDAVIAEANQLLDDLNSEDFKTRENATKVLGERYILYRDLIEKKLAGKPPLEVRNRLQRIVDAHADTPRVTRSIEALGLLEDPAFLVELLEQVKGKEEDVVVKQLEKVTGQKLGGDRAAWKKWLNKSK